jgi:hypothetical protein
MPSNDLLNITITANDGTNHIYISKDTSLNVLTLTLTNTTTGNLIFQQCDTTNCWIGSLPAADTGIYLLFNGLLSNTVIAGITVTAPGWTVYNYSDNQCGNYLVFTPQSTITLAANESLSFTLQLPTVTGSANSGYLSSQYVNVLNDFTQSGGEQLYVMTVYPPHDDGSAAAILPVQFEFVGSNIVHNSGVVNSLSFRITNTSNAALVPGGKASWGSVAPQFKLSFVQDDSGALGSVMNHSQASWVSINIEQAYQNKLRIDKGSGTNPQIWTIEEDESLSGTDGTILGIGKSASIGFSISNLQTNVMPSLSMAVLEYTGFPGYEDGQLTAELQIMNASPSLPVINSFTASPSVVNIRNLSTSVSLNWDVSSASNLLLLRENDTTMSTATLISATTVYVSHTSTYTLIAQNSEGKEVSRTITVQVDTVPIGVIMMWSGAQSTIPSGWYLCDGGTHNGNTTPNLKERFVVGASSDTTSSNTQHRLNQTGGGGTHTHTIITHPKTLNTTSNGSHNHTLPFESKNDLDDNSDSHDRYYYYGSANTNGTVTTTSNGSHNHSISVPGQSFNSGASVADLPPYYALYYIMKCQ